MTKLCKETMIQSYSFISFSPEKRGASDYEYYTNLLKEDLEFLESTGKLGANNNYESKFIDKVMTIYHAQSRCASSFITGPANFPVRKAQKAWDSKDKAFDDFWHWRKKYINAVTRERTLSPEAEIDKALERLQRLEAAKERGNILKKTLRDKKLSNEQKVQILGDIFPKSKPEDIESIVNDSSSTYEKVSTVYNVTTKIRETKKKIEVMKARIEAKNNQKDVYFKGGKIFIENDRVIIQHDEKPERDIIQAIKSNGFRYSPKFKSWVRKHTANARYDANYLLNNVFGGEVKA